MSENMLYSRCPAYQPEFVQPSISVTDFIPRGIENPVQQSTLAAMIGVDKRTVRAMVYQARRHGAVICSTPDPEKGGYYLPESPEEALPYVRFQQSRMNSAAEALRSAVEYVEGSCEI